MENDVTNLLFAGVGGQGVLLASELTARTAINNNFDAKKSEVHGVAQRGGAVVSHVRFGTKVFSPLCWRGKVDIFMALEKLEALRWAHYVKKGGVIIINDQIIHPAQFLEKPVAYPENIIPFLESKGFTIHFIDCRSIARELGNVRAFNVVLLGFASQLLRLEKEIWIKTLRENIPEKFYELNENAFYKGINLYEEKTK